jgi:CMP-N-acetylneuraminic acid synthetase
MASPEKLKIIAIIPARSGSRSIPHKNIQSVKGKPLIAFTIEHALGSKYIQRTIVSTDSEYYASIARSYNAEVPFIRPAAIALDHSTDFEVFDHALNWLKDHENYDADIIVHLRPTTPVRNSSDIDAMIDLLIHDAHADSVRSVIKNMEPVFKMWWMDDKGYLSPVVTDSRFVEAYNMPRQALPECYLQNASIDVTRAKTILEKKSMTGEKILGYLMESSHDIDYRHQLNNLSVQVTENRCSTFVFDIDGVVAFISPANNYLLARPNFEVINKINELFDAGHRIILFTARGSKTGIDWTETTEQQMKEWGVKFHEIRFGKPAADYYIDDRMLSINEILNFKINHNGKL